MAKKEPQLTPTYTGDGLCPNCRRFCHFDGGTCVNCDYNIGERKIVLNDDEILRRKVVYLEDKLRTLEDCGRETSKSEREGLGIIMVSLGILALIIFGFLLAVVFLVAGVLLVGVAGAMLVIVVGVILTLSSTT